MKKIAIYRPTTIDGSHSDPVTAWHRGGGVCRRHRPADSAQEPAEAGARRYLVDIKKINDLRYIKEDAQGGRADRRVDETGGDWPSPTWWRRNIRCWRQAIGMISSPELRNASTLGGDLLQEVWCQYLRGGYSCWRNGGYICYGAIGDNSYYHSAMGGRLCYAVYPGDAATALIPFDAPCEAGHAYRRQRADVEQLVPGDMMVDGRIQSHVVRSNEILTEVMLPAPKAGAAHLVREDSARGASGILRWRRSA